MSDSDKDQRSDEDEEDEEDSEQGEEEDPDEGEEDDENDDQEQEQEEDQEKDEQEQSGDEEDQQEEQHESPPKGDQDDDYKLPQFHKLPEPSLDQVYSIQNIALQLNSLQHSVDAFISSLSSTPSLSNLYTQTNTNTEKGYFSRLPVDSLLNRNAIHIKDNEVQVDLQAPIIIHQVQSQDHHYKKKNSYTINSESQSYLSRMSERVVTDPGRFERKQEDMIDWERRNREIDQAMRVMREDRL